MAELSFDAPKISADVSSYGGSQAQSPFGVLGDVLQFQGAMTRNALYAQELQLKRQEFIAKRAMGEIIQQNMDPASGTPNWIKAGIQMSADPRTAFLAPDFLKNLQERQLLDAQIFEKEFSNVQNMTNTLANAWTPLVRKMEANGGLLEPDADDPQKADLKPLYEQAALIVGQQPEFADRAIQILSQLKSVDRATASKMVADLAKSTLIQKQGLDGVSTAMNFKTVDPLTGKPMETYGRVDRFSGEFTPYTTARPTPLAEAPQEAQDTGTSAGTMKPQESKPQELPGVTQMGAPLSVQTGLDPFKEKQLEDIGSKYVPELNERVRDANQLLTLMSQVKDELKDFKPGGGAELRVQLGTLADALGMPDDVKNSIAMGDLSSAQAARKLFFGIGSQMAAQLIRAGGGRMTQTEWAQTLAKGSPNLDLTPEAINKIFSAMKELVHYTQLEQRAFNEYRDRGRDLTQWNSTWTDLLNQLIERREAKRRGG